MRGSNGASSVATGRALCAIILCATLIFSSCASIKGRASANPLGALGDGASLYLVLPVRGNEPLLESVASRVMKEGDARAVLGRTDALYAGAYGSGASSFRFIATGSFSPSFSGLVFKKSAGWDRVKSDGVTVYRSARFDAAIAGRGAFCGLVQRRDVSALPSEANGESRMREDDTLISLVSRVRSGGEPLSGITPEFAEYASRAASDGRIGLYSENPAPLLSKILGPEVSLPVTRMECYAMADGDDYVISAHLVLADSRSARAVRSLLGIAFRDSAIVVDGDTVSISGYRVSREKLAAAADFLYLYQK